MLVNVKGFEFDPTYINKIEVRIIPDGRGSDLGSGLWIKFSIGEDIKIPIGSESDAIQAKTQLIGELSKLGLHRKIDI